MPTIKLTKRNIECLPVPVIGQVIYRDKDLPGYGLLAGTRTQSFFVEGQIGRRTVRATIGRYPRISPERARVLAMRALSDMAEGRHPSAERRILRSRSMTVEEAFTAFFAGRTHLSPRTVKDYGRSVKVYLSDWLRRPIAEITREMVLEQHRKIAVENGPTTANSVFRHLRSVYNYTAATAGELPPNPVTVLTQSRSWNPERRRRSVVPLHALPRWYAAVLAEDESARDFLLVAILTGMRRSEVAGLEWANIDLDGRTLTVAKTKNGDALILPLSTPLFDILLARRDNNPEATFVFPGVGVTGHLVEMKSFVARVVRASGVQFGLHDLRRTYATIAEGLDVSYLSIKYLLNHRCTDITGRYVILNVERLRPPAELIAQKILEVATSPVLSLAA